MRYILFFCVGFLLCSCYSGKTISSGLSPHQPAHTYEDGPRTFSYTTEDSITVSTSYYGEVDSSKVFLLSVDNYSSTPITFDPEQIYLIAYSNDSSISTSKVFYAQNTDSMLVALDKEIEELQQKQKINTGGRIALGVAYFVVSIVGIANGDSELLLGADVVHDVSQTALAISAIDLDDRTEKNFIKHERVYNEGLYKTDIEPGGAVYGKVYIVLPNSEQYRMYVPVEGNTFRFAFKRY